MSLISIYQKAPKRLSRDKTSPHVTIQMPVYKEELNAVMRPTIASLKAAISTYEMQGGMANIFGTPRLL